MLYKRFMALADRGHTDTHTHTHTQSKYYNPPAHARRALMSRHADRQSSPLYLTKLKSMQCGCKFATICDRKG